MRALVVGAGAVGQVYGYHLARGGAEVTFLVKEEHVEDCRRGFTLYPLGRPRGRPVRLEGCGIVTSAAGGMWDQIYVTVSSIALRTGTWLDELARDSGDATIVVLQPGLDDPEVVAARVAPPRIVVGTIFFLAYRTPLPTRERAGAHATTLAEPGVAYWLYPRRAPFSGDPLRATAVVSALRAGRLPARVARDSRRETALPTAILEAFVAALEAAGWSFARMRAEHLVATGARAAAEGLRVVAHELGIPIPLALRAAASPLGFRTALALSPRVVPTDLESYLEVHFTKVRDQMHASLHHLIERGRTAGLPTPALSELAARVMPA
jgi:2-dehydropantoate 2-reductase